MDYTKTKILIENLTSRTPGLTYGVITAGTINVSVFLTQTMDDMGMFTDVEYTPSSAATATTVDDYFTTFASNLTGLTDSKLTAVKSYSRSTPYKLGFDTNKETYIGYSGDSVDGRSRLTSTGTPLTYVVDTNYDEFIGTTAQTTGILYKDYDDTRLVVDSQTGTNKLIKRTTFQTNEEGWNETNTSLSAITKEEIYLGLISTPEVENDVFIERGSTSPLESHLRLSEIESVEHLDLYGNGYYNLIK